MFPSSDCRVMFQFDQPQRKSYVVDKSDSQNLPLESLTPDYIALQNAAPLAGQIVASVLGFSVREMTPVYGLGAVNLICFVETNELEVVVRLSKPDDDTEKMRREYEKERWCIERASAAGVPSPVVLAVGEHAGRAYMLQERVPGVNGKQSDVPAEELLRQLGRYARIIHTLPVDGFGDNVQCFESGKAEEGWRRFIDYNLGALSEGDPLIELGVYLPEQQETIREAFSWLRGLPLKVGLNHGDLARRNTIVDEKTRRVTLLDWGCAEMNIVPHYELNAFLHWYQPDDSKLHAFLDGYGITKDDWAALQPELTSFVLLKSFDLTRWAIDRCPARTAELADQAKQCLASWREVCG